MRVRPAFVLCWVLSLGTGLARGQAIINTFAGGGLPDGTPALFSPLGRVNSVAADSAGNLYILDQAGTVIHGMDSAGGLTLLVGNGTAGYAGDGGPALGGVLSYASAMARDSAGNLFVADSLNNRIRRVAADTGVIMTVAGNGNLGFSGDGGPATSATLAIPEGIALDGVDNLYIADTINNRIRRVAADTGVITTVAGDGNLGFSGDGGPATSAMLASPRGIVAVGAGDFWIADVGNQRVRMVAAATGVITTVAGNGIPGFSGDGGPAVAAQLNSPIDVRLDAFGNLLIADNGNLRVRRVDAGTGVISTIAGNGTLGFSGDGGLATDAQLAHLSSIDADSSGNLFIADNDNGRVRQVAPDSGIISTIAGTGTEGDGGPANSSILTNPTDVTVDSAGNFIIADFSGARLRSVSGVDGTITTIAGTGRAGFSGDGGPATSADLFTPQGVALDSAGDIYVAVRESQRIRRIDAATGVITTVAGTGIAGFSGDGGPATEAQLQDPRYLAVDAAGNFYIADTANQRIRRVHIKTGIITTFAGTGVAGFSGDGGQATSAQLRAPRALTFDAAGNLLIADTGNQRIRRVAAGTGVITTVAGNGTFGFSGDGGPATSAALAIPFGVAVDAAGNLFIADSGNERIRMVAASTGVITTVAGTGVPGFSGDGGPALSARLSFPQGVAVDASGNLYVSEFDNHRIRVISGLAPAAASAPQRRSPRASK